MKGWIMLSGAGPSGAAASPPVKEGILAVELALPAEDPAVLLDCQPDGARGPTLALVHDRRVGLTLLHRDSAGHFARHCLPGPLPQSGLGRVEFRFDRAGRWSLRLDRLDGTLPFAARGAGALAMDPALLSAGQAGPATLWWGLSGDQRLPCGQGWLDAQFPVATPRGLIPAGMLAVGDTVFTGQGPRRLRALHHTLVPARGSQTPVHLRTPWFGRHGDMTVSSCQMVALSGPEVEYNFAEDEVLVQAAMLSDARIAPPDERQGVIAAVLPDLGGGAMILGDGLAIWWAPPSDPAPLRVLTPGEAAVLRTALAGNRLSRAA